jgi:anhydro-N-acetylmuramic acid kinase
MEELLDELLLHSYFSRSPPKSTGHEQFGEQFFERCRKRALEIGGKQDDLLATLVALTVESVARAAERFFAQPAERWILYGGGARNRAILEGLRKRLAPVPVDLSDAHGIPGDALEAIAFAVLGHASARGEPGNLPEATGAARRVVLGSATPPCAFRVGRDH